MNDKLDDYMAVNYQAERTAVAIIVDGESLQVYRSDHQEFITRGGGPNAVQIFTFHKEVKL